MAVFLAQVKTNCVHLNINYYFIITGCFLNYIYLKNFIVYNESLNALIIGYVPFCTRWWQLGLMVSLLDDLLNIRYVLYLNGKKNIAEMSNYAPIDYYSFQLYQYSGLLKK